MAFRDNVSENIAFLEEHPEMFIAVRNKSYTAHVELGDDYLKRGEVTVWNALEDSEAKVKEGCFVITGCAGEKWTTSKVDKYGVTADQIPEGGLDVQTKETDEILFAVSIKEQFTAKTSWAELNGNKPFNSRNEAVPHGNGDYLLIDSKVENGKIVPDFDSEPRIVNGSIMGALYQSANDVLRKKEITEEDVKGVQCTFSIDGKEIPQEEIPQAKGNADKGVER